VVRERSGGRQCENYVSSGRDEGFEEVENGVVRADGVEGMGKGLALERFEDFGGYFWVSVVEYEVCSQRFDVFMLLPSMIMSKLKQSKMSTAKSGAKRYTAGPRWRKIPETRLSR